MCKTYTIIAEDEDNDFKYTRYEIPEEEYDEVKKLLNKLDVG